MTLLWECLSFLIDHKRAKHRCYLLTGYSKVTIISQQKLESFNLVYLIGCMGFVLQFIVSQSACLGLCNQKKNLFYFAISILKSVGKIFFPLSLDSLLKTPRERGQVPSYNCWNQVEQCSYLIQDPSSLQGRYPLLMSH